MSTDQGEGTQLLANAEQLRIRDTGRMLDILGASPDRLVDADMLGKQFEPRTASSVRNVVVTGLGGSAIGGEVMQSLVGSECRVPVMVNREYHVPGFVGPDTLVIACSYSGNTGETLQAYRMARERGAQLVVITSGGQLSERAVQEGVPLLSIPPGSPPRTAIAYSVIPMLWILHRAGLWRWQEGVMAETVAMVAAARDLYRPEVPPESNAAKMMALRLRDKIPVIYAPSHPLGAVATRWRGQFAENGKSLASHHVLPEMMHNEIVGWKHPSLIEKMHALCLRDPAEHPQVSVGFEFLIRTIGSRPATLEQHRGSGESLMARMFSLIVLGDYASVYLAFLYGEDPTPVAVIDRLKQELKKSS
jgi:glucose/mannose-6-phosphate isomerase